jgi:hypothetical protein
MEAIRSAKPRDKAYELRDTQTRGLILRVQPRACKTFYCQAERAKRVKIGRADLLTLTQARNRCLEILGQAARGEDQSVAPDPKLGDYAKGQYREWCLAHLKSGAMDPDRLVSGFADMLDRRLSKITCEIVDAWVLRRLNDGRSPYTLRRDVAVLRSALRKAVRWRLSPKDPLEGITHNQCSRQCPGAVSERSRARAAAGCLGWIEDQGHGAVGAQYRDASRRAAGPVVGGC